MAVQTMKTPENTTFTVYLFTTMYAKNTAWAKISPVGHDQCPLVTQVRNYATIESVAEDPDKQHLTVPFVMFRIDVQQLLEKLVTGPVRKY